MSRERPGRLPSLRGPRDLTLGGVRKKTFAPNIPVRKERNKQEVKDDQSQPALKDRSKRGRQRGRGRGRGRGRPDIIQSHSIFEAGPSAEPVVKHSDAAFGTGGGGGCPSKDAIEKPSIKHEIFDEDLERSKTEEALRNLEGGSGFIADMETDDTLLPTCLPMKLASWPPAATAEAVKKDAASKPSEDSSVSECAAVFKNIELKQDGHDPTDIIIFQLPDTLPAVPPFLETEVKNEPGTKVKQESDVKIKQEPGSEAGNNEDSDHCTFDQLTEGYIGKLQVMRSGHCRLLLGGIILDLNTGTPSSFQEELASIRLPPEGQDTAQGHLTVLGNVSHKIICTPNMEHLIQQTKS